MNYLDNIEKQNIELREKLEGALYQSQKQAKEIEKLNRCYQIMFETLEDFKNFGCRMDTNPTINFNDTKSILETYNRICKGQEEYVRETSSEALKSINKIIYK